MKVKVRKLTKTQKDSEEDNPLIRRLHDREQGIIRHYPEAEAKWERYLRQCEIRDRLEQEYYEMFPDDPPIFYAMDVDNTPSFDPFIMTDMYTWALENRRHWYEWHSLPASYAPDMRMKGGPKKP